MIKLDDVKSEVVLSVLLRIDDELRRCFWNRFHQPLESPFENTSNRYINDTFEARAYYWGDDENEMQKPNFKYKDLECFWYKYATRGFVAYCDKDITMEYMSNMLADCKYAIRKDFGELYDEEEEEEEEKASDEK